MKFIKLIRVVALALTITLAVVIFLFSATPADASKEQSGGIAEVLVELFYGERDEFTESEYTAIYGRVDHAVRKTAHFSVYLCLGVSVFGFACTYNIKTLFKTGGAFAFSALYAASDEFHQLFVPGRSGQISDVLLDSAGAAVGIIISYIIIYRCFVARKLKTATK